MSAPKVLLFNPAADRKFAVWLHTSDCSLADTSRRRALRVEGTEIERMSAILHREGYPIRECSCLTKEQLALIPTD